jgi:hypothetical protein
MVVRKVSGFTEDLNRDKQQLLNSKCTLGTGTSMETSGIETIIPTF